ncbi:hypothetical protein [Rhodococcus wratislaviensis]|uniref:hypothetical protein n=1 Tax=Rhodococcus wratislaviensis TaxID=44752 RepID=UPI00365A356F
MTMAHEPPPGKTQVAVVGRRTPMVLSVARSLREGLSRGASVTVPDAPKSVHLKSATDAQNAHLTFWDDRIVVSADGSTAPDVTWSVQWTDPAKGITESEGAPAELSYFAKEVAHVLSGRDISWDDAAQAFWARVHDLAGVPSPLSVTCSDGSKELVLGTATSASVGYRIHGTAASLVRFFEGRSLIIDELATGELTIDGGLAGFSGLYGANVKVVCGER